MIRILVQSTHLKISYEFAVDGEIEIAEGIIVPAFKAEDTTLKRTYLVRSGKASAIKSFYIQDHEDPRLSKNLLPSGFLKWLMMYFDEAKLEYEVVDMRKWPTVDKEFATKLAHSQCAWDGRDGNTYSPRDYQAKSTIKAAKEHGGIIQLPTGTGKGFIVALIARMYSKHRVLCMFDQIDLVSQTRDAFIQKYGFSESEVGIIQGQNFQDDRRITFMSVASYEKAFHIFPSQRVIIVDECHALASGTGGEMSTRVLYACQNAPLRIGLSATADAIDNPYRQMALYGNLGPIIYDEHIQDKVEDGTLADVEVEMHRVAGFIIPVTGNWADSYEEVQLKTKAQKRKAEEIGCDIVIKEGKEYARRMTARGDESTHYVFNDIRNDLIADLALKHPRVLILYTRREHGERLMKKIEKLGGKAKLIGGLDDPKIREEAKQFLLEAKDHIILASNIFKKGVDIPWLHTLIIAGAGKGTAMVIQRFGRSTRKDKGTDKTTAKVIDFIDSFSKMGARQSARRMEIYKDKLGFKVNVI